MSGGAIGPARRSGRTWTLLLIIVLLGQPAAEALTIATYNVENYTLADRVIEAGYRTAYPKPEREKAALRRVIRDLDADVLALQEVGGEEFLRELQRDLASEGVIYPHATVLLAADEERRLAVLSRRPFSQVQRHVDLTLTYFGEQVPVSRGLLEVRVPASGGEVTLFVVHLKSRYTDRDDDPASARRRAGEAVAVRDRVRERFPDEEAATARFLILGDFNDHPRSRAVAALTRIGETRTLAGLLPAADSRGHAWTHHFKRDDTYSRVDHVLVSPALASAVTGGGARIHDGEAVVEASDHRPIVVRLAE